RGKLPPQKRLIENCKLNTANFKFAPLDPEFSLVHHVYTEYSIRQRLIGCRIYPDTKIFGIATGRK
ncbi:hypothetical protein KAX22_10735, partial [bacterium]|nr:hypothetical protein [bacterium]